MNRGRILLLTAVVLSGVSCSQKDALFQAGDNSAVELQITFRQAASRLGDSGLGKVVTVTAVVVTVTGPGMSAVTKALAVDLVNQTASGSVDVPKGNNRTFQVDGKDENDIVQFSGSATKDIMNDTETVGIDVSWIPPDPVDVTFSNITTSSAEVSWTASGAPDFYFYRVLLSTSPQLDVSNDQLGDDIYDRSSTQFSLSGLSENTVYYIAVIAVDTELWYSGSLAYSDQYSVVEKLTTAREVQLGYDDNEFENALRGLNEGTRLVVLFTCPSTPCYIKTILLHLRDESGQNGNYRLVIVDSARNDLFRSEEALATQPGEDWVGWDLIWNDRADGTVITDFYAGIEYARTDDNNWPLVGFDESSDSQRGYFVDTEGSWVQLGEFEFYGNRQRPPFICKRNKPRRTGAQGKSK
ncbi:MAG: fibronectin type III domain-containing protein [Fidelibacterota bacterium]